MNNFIVLTGLQDFEAPEQDLQMLINVDHIISVSKDHNGVTVLWTDANYPIVVNETFKEVVELILNAGGPEDADII